MKNKNRSIYLINPKFQWSVILKFIGLAVFNILSFYVLIYLFFSNLETKASYVGLKDSHPFLVFVHDQKMLMTFSFIVVAIVNLSVIICMGVFISHRIAGPLHRLKSYMNDCEIDEIPQIKFRKKDYFIDLQDAFNSFVSRIKKDD